MMAAKTDEENRPLRFVLLSVSGALCRPRRAAATKQAELVEMEDVT
jgi:hypothetical protein